MANVTVPRGMVPGRAGYAFATAGPSPCDAGPDSAHLQPGAYIQVRVLQDVNAAGVPGACTPDAAGRLLHPLWKFVRPRQGRRGKRRQIYPNWPPAGLGSQYQVWVETDPGCYWIGTAASVFFVGGTPGDKYFVSVAYSTPRDDRDPDRAIDVYEKAFQFRLSSLIVSPDGFTNFQAAPDWHTHFQIQAGPAQIVSPLGIVPLGSTPLDKPAPLNLGLYQTKTGLFYTQGAL